MFGKTSETSRNKQVTCGFKIYSEWKVLSWTQGNIENNKLDRNIK